MRHVCTSPPRVVERWNSVGANCKCKLRSNIEDAREPCCDAASNSEIVLTLLCHVFDCIFDWVVVQRCGRVVRMRVLVR